MAKSTSVKVQVMFPAGLHARLVSHAERSGLPLTQALMSLVDRYVSLNNEAGGTASSPNKTPITTLRAQLKNAQGKVVAKLEEHEVMRRKHITITADQLNELYDLVADAAQIKHQLGEGDHPDEVMKRRYTHDLYRLEDGFEYETIRYEGGQMTDEGVRQYKELESHINTLKDRLK